MLFLSCIAAFVYIRSMGPRDGMPEDGVFLPVDVPTQHLMDGGSTLVAPSQADIDPAAFLCQATQCVICLPCMPFVLIANCIEAKGDISEVIALTFGNR